MEVLLILRNQTCDHVLINFRLKNGMNKWKKAGLLPKSRQSGDS